MSLRRFRLAVWFARNLTFIKRSIFVSEKSVLNAVSVAVLNAMLIAVLIALLNAVLS